MNKTLSSLLDSPSFDNFAEEVFSLPKYVLFKTQINFLEDNFVKQVILALMDSYQKGYHPNMTNQIGSSVTLDDVETIIELNIIEVERILVQEVLSAGSFWDSEWTMPDKIKQVDKLSLSIFDYKYSSVRKIDHLFKLYKVIRLRS